MERFEEIYKMAHEMSESEFIEEMNLQVSDKLMMNDKSSSELVNKMKSKLLEFNGIQFNEMIEQDKHKDVASARLFFIYVLYFRYEFTYPYIARLMNRTRSTIVIAAESAKNRIRNKDDRSESFKKFIEYDFLKD